MFGTAKPARVKTSLEICNGFVLANKEDRKPQHEEDFHAKTKKTVVSHDTLSKKSLVMPAWNR